MPATDDMPQTMGLQLSLYPLRQAHLRPAVTAAVEAASAAGLMVRVGELSSFAAADEDRIFAGLRAAFDAARALGPTVMVATLAADVPSEETVREIQRALDGGG